MSSFFGIKLSTFAKNLTGLWSDLVGGVSHAPDRQRGTVGSPLARLHVFRNRLAHHQRVWSHALEEGYLLQPHDVLCTRAAGDAAEVYY
jgi:hypothetical protein